MRLGAVAFLLGILLFQQLAELPQTLSLRTLLWVALLLVVSVALFSYYTRKYPGIDQKKWLVPLLFLVVGFHWAFLQAVVIMSTTLPASLEKQDVVVQGSIASLPQQQGRKWRFLFDIERLQHAGNLITDLPGRVRLNWYGKSPELNVGDRWQLTVRLKKPHGFMNPGGFDYEGWLFQQRIRATGYVRTSEENRLLSSDDISYPLQRIRQSLAESITAQLDYPEFSGIVMALAIGERQAISESQWDVLRKTGTIHLVAISGLHIGLVAGMVFIIVQFLWPRLASVTLHWPAPRVAAIAGLLAATLYASLAGFTIPTQRALVMVAVVMLMLYLQRQRRFSDTLALALLALLVIDPMAVMSIGFWLSFSAVAAIIFAMSGRLNRGVSASRARELWWRWGRVHLVVAVALLPLLLLIFQQFPLLSPFANFIAVPWVSLCVVPLVLLGTVISLGFSDFGAVLLNMAATALAWLWPFLEWVANQEEGLWQQHPPVTWALLAALFGVLLLLSPSGLPGRWLGIIWLLPLLLITPPRPAEGEWWFTLLDTGQGLAAVIQTRNHLLLYDTGPRFSDSFDTGRAVVVPFLNSVGINSVDLLVISHGDNDHMGGARSITKLLEVKRIITSVPEKVTWQTTAERCISGQQWQWDGVLFEMLHPPPTGFNGNDASCVLKVGSVASSGERGTSLLLTGDIEARAERDLLRQNRDKLRSRIVVAPHHGSNSSSSGAFVKAVSPQFVLFPVGYLNRYRFPHAVVTARYHQHGAIALNSANDGAITFKVDAAGEIAAVQRFRQSNGRYWHSKEGGE